MLGCVCSSELDDHKYGRGQRVHRLENHGQGMVAVCTCCLRVKAPEEVVVGAAPAIKQCDPQLALRNPRGEEVSIWIGAYLVAFDAEGNAVGVVQEGNTKISPPAALPAAVLDRAKLFPGDFLGAGIVGPAPVRQQQPGTWPPLGLVIDMGSIGLGDALMVAGLARAVRQTWPNCEVLYYGAQHRALFDNNPNLVACTPPAPVTPPEGYAVIKHPGDFVGLWEPEKRVFAGQHWMEVLFSKAGLLFDPYYVRRAYYPTAEETKWAQDLVSRLPRPLVAVHPYCSDTLGNKSARVWALSNWNELLPQLPGTKLLIGAGNEPALNPHGSLQDFRGKHTLRQTMALVAQADLTLCVDSFIMHAAEAVGCPHVVALWGATSPQLSGLFMEGVTNLEPPQHLCEQGPCWAMRPCSHPCIDRISVGQVKQAAEMALRRPAKRQRVALRTLVATAVLSEEVKPMAAVTLPRQRDYALKCGADFLVRGITRPDLDLFWWRLTLADLFDHYDRILILDADVLIRRDAPDLFEMVAPDEVGMVAERFPVGQEARRNSLRKYYEDHKLTWPGDDKWDGQHYYNIGVMLASRCHAPLLEIPEDLWHGFCNEQCLVSGRLISTHQKVRELGWQFNRMPQFDGLPGTPPMTEAFFAHVSGMTPFVQRTPRALEIEANWKGRGL